MLYGGHVCALTDIVLYGGHVCVLTDIVLDGGHVCVLTDIVLYGGHVCVFTECQVCGWSDRGGAGDSAHTLTGATQVSGDGRMEGVCY